MSGSELLMETARMLAPAWVLVLGGCLLICSSVCFTSRQTVEDKRSILGGLSVFFLLVAALFYWFGPQGGAFKEVGLFTLDATTIAATRLSLIGGIILVLIGWSTAPKNYLPEYYGCLLLILAGIPLVAASNDLIPMFLALELVSIPTYVLLSVAKGENIGLEASLRYFLLSAFASALFLLGVSYLYGVSGSMDLPSIHQTIAAGGLGKLGYLGVLLILCGLAFRITAVPFHFYAPDVFEGTSLILASIMSYLPKVAGFVAMIRICYQDAAAGAMVPTVLPILLVAAALTMTVGNAMASSQTSLRRLLGYSSVAHTGYLLLAFAALLLMEAELNVIFTYLAAYAVMTLGVFAGLAEVDEAGGRTTTVSDLSGLFFRRPAATIAMSVCLVSLIGLPFTAGFVAKLQIFIAAAGTGRWDMTMVTLLMAFNAAIAAGYYFKVLSKLYERGFELTPLRLWRPSLFLAYSICAVLTIVWFFQSTLM